MQETKTRPFCPYCGRAFEPGVFWQGANYCRAAWLADFIRDNPGLSAWEISQRSGLLYGDVTKGLAKGREWEIFRVEPEDRDNGGIRYRYWLGKDATEVIDQWRKKAYV